MTAVRRPADLAWQEVSLHSLYTTGPCDATGWFDRVALLAGRMIDGVQRRQFLHGSRPLAWLASGGELAADHRPGLVDRATPVRIEKTAGLVKR